MRRPPPHTHRPCRSRRVPGGDRSRKNAAAGGHRVLSGVHDDHNRRTDHGRRRAVRKGEQITGTAREKLAREMKEQYEGGRSIRAIAEAYGRSYGFVHRVLTETDVSLRGRGGEHPQRRLGTAAHSGR
nr:helix-turn-helix domain-containing protein [Streptomyces sp. PBH53]